MLKVLAIDDEQLILSLIENVLNRFGFKVETASNGKEGIQKFDTAEFDLIITDINMPGMDGNGVARHIRISEKRYTPIIGITGTPWLVEEKDFDLIIKKPFSIKLLVDSVINLTVGNEKAVVNC